MNRKSLLIAMGIVLGCASVPLTASADEYRVVRTQDGYRDVRTQDGYRDGYYDRDYRGNRSEWRDERIENRVEYALSRSLGSDANDINVQVRNRNVYLSGRVDRPVERVRAARVANNVEGVRNVYADRLRVRRY